MSRAAHPSGKQLGARMPFFLFPRARLVEMIDPYAVGLRTLPDDQLAAELEQLVSTCASADHHLADRLMHRMYLEETARRADPCRRFDADLHAALSRLATKTNEHDRRLVEGVGRRLLESGGAEALLKARDRMLALVAPGKQALRLRILENRWAGI